MRELTPPRGRDAIVALAAMAAAYVLLIGQGLILLNAGISRALAVGLLPVIVVVSLVVPTVVLIHYMRGRGLELGLVRLGRRGWHLLWQIPTVVIGSAASSALVGPLLGMEPGGESAAEKIAADADSVVPVLVLLAGYLLIGPFIEELVFRRVLLHYFDTLMPGVLSVLLSSAIFGVVHIAPVAMVYTFFCGVGFALVARFHGGITASFIAHAANNVLASMAVITALF